MASDFITGIDIGTSSIKVAVLQKEKNHPSLKFVSSYTSSGVRRGAIVDLAEASQALSKALSEVKKVSKSALKNIYATIGTTQVKIQTVRGIVAVSRADSEIYEEDIGRVIAKANETAEVGPNRTIIHNIAKEFIVDGVGDISDPLGLSGSRLEVDSLVVSAFAPHIKNLVKIIELGGGEIGGLVFSPLAAAQAALSKKQKDLGVVLIDIGAGTTGVAVYEENKLIGLAKFPVGAGNVSNDIAVGFKVPVTVAEELKLNYGYALTREIGPREVIELKKIYPEAKNTISRRFLAEIIESRLAEILEFVNNELKLLGKAGKLPGGVVLVGGGSKMPGLAELVKEELKLSSQVGFTTSNVFESGSEFSDFLEDPEYASVFGLILWAAEEEGWNHQKLSSRFKIKNFLRYFIP